MLASDGAVVRVGGLSGLARIGDGVDIDLDRDTMIAGEVIALGTQEVTVLLERSGQGIGAGGRAWLKPHDPPCPSEAWLGRVVDGFGRLADGRLAPKGCKSMPLRAPPPGATGRRGLGDRLATGLAAFDTLLPICRGQRMGLFAGPGVGKSMLLGRLARTLQADVAVVGLIGERGREVGSFVRETLGPDGMARSVVVAATSDASALAKRRASLLALAVAERFRDRGANVLLLFDSLTRFAEAHREIALAAGEAPALRAYPPSTAAEIAGLCERAGPGGPGQGDITAVFTVLVAGSDMDEPVADMVRGVLDGHVVLDREIAERGRFPAIDIVRSVSRAAPAAWTEAEARLARDARRLVALHEQSLPMIRAGLYRSGGDAELDRAVALSAALDRFIGQETPRGERHVGFATLEAILAAETAEAAMAGCSTRV